MESNNVGMSAAAAFYQSIVGFILVLAANTIVKKVDSENAFGATLRSTFQFTLNASDNTVKSFIFDGQEMAQVPQ